EGQRRRIDNAGIAGTHRKQFRRHDRAGVQADRAPRDEIPSTHGSEVRRTRARADEVDGHGVSPESASAQVAGPTAMRGAMSRAAGPAAGRAAASATDGTPARAMTRSDRVAARIPAAARSPCGIRTRGTPIDDAAAAMPGSPPLAADVAIRRSCDAATPARAN